MNVLVWKVAIKTGLICEVREKQIDCAIGVYVLQVLGAMVGYSHYFRSDHLPSL